MLCSQVNVADTAMKEASVLENVMNAIETLASSIPGGAVNIRSLHIKIEDSPSLPIYISKGMKDSGIFN